LAALVVLFLVAIVSVGAPATSAGVAGPEVAPAFNLRLLDGTTLKSGDLQGSVVVLRFLASW
jgi:hypothetical protein